MSPAANQPAKPKLPPNALREQRRKIMSAIQTVSLTESQIDLRICRALDTIKERGLHVLAINEDGSARFANFEEFYADLLKEARVSVRNLPPNKRKTAYKRINEALAYNALDNALPSGLPRPILRGHLQALETYPEDGRVEIWKNAVASAQASGKDITAVRIHMAAKVDPQKLTRSASDKLAELVGYAEQILPHVKITAGDGATQTAAATLVKLQNFVAEYRLKQRKRRPAPPRRTDPAAPVVAGPHPTPPPVPPAPAAPAAVPAAPVPSPVPAPPVPATAPGAVAAAKAIDPSNLESPIDPLTHDRPFVGWQTNRFRQTEVVVGFPSPAAYSHCKSHGFPDLKTRGYGAPKPEQGNETPPGKFYWRREMNRRELPAELDALREALRKANG